MCKGMHQVNMDAIRMVDTDNLEKRLDIIID